MNLASVEQKAESPPGNVPKNRQHIIMVAVALVIVLAVVFTGSTSPTPRKAAPAPMVGPQSPPSKGDIDLYRKRLQEEEARLRQAQIDAERTRATYSQQTAPTGMQGGIPGQAIMGPNGQPYYPTAQSTASEPQKDTVEQDREKREYTSLFASNVALSFRRDPSLSANPAAVAPAVSPSAPIAPVTPVPAPTAPVGGYTLFEGTILEAVLTNRLEGSFTGPVNCQVTTDVYSTDHQHLLIPKGSRILGEAREIADRDQQRLAVTFHRLIMPSGYSVSLERVLGLDQAGATGLKDKVNNHYVATFGTSIALGLLAGLSGFGTGSVFTADGADMYRQGVANQLGRDSTRILDRRLNAFPTITIREGTRVKILLSADLALPEYAEDRRLP